MSFAETRHICSEKSSSTSRYPDSPAIRAKLRFSGHTGGNTRKGAARIRSQLTDRQIHQSPPRRRAAFHELKIVRAEEHGVDFAGELRRRPKTAFTVICLRCPGVKTI
jgi:hypothetical protein